MEFTRIARCSLAGVASSFYIAVGMSSAHAALADAPAPLREVARAQGDGSVFRVYCKRDGRYVATMKIDLKAGTVNDTPYRIDGNTIRWSARNAPAGQAAPERAMEVEGLRYTGPTLGGGVDTYPCEPSKERPAGIIYSP